VPQNIYFQDGEAKAFQRLGKTSASLGLITVAAGFGNVVEEFNLISYT